MTQDPQISIIIPIYKVEKFLEECLDSVKRQSFTAFEAILIDDKSPDNSLAIAKNFAAEDSRFILFEQPENKGYGAAMNLGISKVRSPYMTFLESDDFLAENALEILYNAMQKEKVDLVWSSYFYCNFISKFKHFVVTNWAKIPSTGVSNSDQKPDIFLARTEPWGILYNVNFWKTHDLHFLENKIENRWLMYQDLWLAFATRLCAQKILVLATPLYYYRIHQDNSVAEKGKHQNSIFFPFLFEEINKLIKEKKNPQINSVKHKIFYDILVSNFIFFSEPIKEKLRKICSQDLPLENPYLTVAQNQRYIHFIQGKSSDLRSPLEQIIRSNFFRPAFFWIKWFFYRLPLSIRKILKK